MTKRKLSLPEANWRTNSKRVVRLHGRLNLAAARKASKRIGMLKQKSSAPIIIQIHSEGGRVNAFYELEQIFTACCARGEPCQFVTIASEANSAAAYLLVAGHYACVQNNTHLGFHGVRVGRFNKMRTLKREQILAMGMRMDRENRNIAKIMTVRVLGRVLARYVELKQSNQMRQEEASSLACFECFIQAISSRLNLERSKRLLTAAWRRSSKLFSVIRSFSRSSKHTHKVARIEAKIFKALIEEAENACSSTHNTIKPSIAIEIVMDYLLARDFVRGQNLDLLDELMKTHGINLMTPKENASYQRIMSRSPTEARCYLGSVSMPRIYCLWCISFGLCQRLLSGEFVIPANDAYWLGLVDEVLR